MDAILNESLQHGDDENDELTEIRPQGLEQFIGQNRIRENLRVFITAAKKRKKALDHVILSGPPGLGKTTLARIIANELGKPLHTAMAPNLTKRGDLAQILTVLKEGDVLFIDEIHRLAGPVEEVLYSAMEDHTIDLILGEGLGAKSVSISLQPFTLIGATTRLGDLSPPLMDRFGIPVYLDYYEAVDLEKIIERSAGIFGVRLTADARAELAGRSRRTPRIANRLVKWVRDHAVAYNRPLDQIDGKFTGQVLEQLEIDSLGLGTRERDLLKAIIEQYDGGPVGLKVLAVLLGEGERTVEEAIEPFLVRSGLIIRTPRGRVAGRLSYEHLGLSFGRARQMTIDKLLSSGPAEQEELF